MPVSEIIYLPIENVLPSSIPLITNHILAYCSGNDNADASWEEN